MPQPFCKPCLEKGHQCLAIDVIWKPDEIPQCAFCEDGIPCPIAQRSVDPVLRDRPQHRPTLAGDKFNVGKDRAGSKKVETTISGPGLAMDLALGGPRQVKSAVSEEPKMEGKKCGREGCGKVLTERNESGFCSAHYFDSKRKKPRPAEHGAVKAAQPKGPRRVADPRPEITAKAPAGHNGNGHSDSLTVTTLMVTESQLDEMFMRWPLEDKTICIQMFLNRSAQ